MSRISPAARWWGLPVFTAVVCAAAAVANFVVGNWAAGGVLVTLALITLMDRRTQVLSYRAGYWRGRYEENTDDGDLDAKLQRLLSGEQPSPWDPPPLPPWDRPISPTKH
jgi:hypothetical protein